ncbi:metallophosphoesterase family protein [Carboxydochorda subterranea]|uniref:Metallophosphoesterase family protein n=1 Tax=Carboxydichorda subterranea TaxID=3109565 RepID=A0ABZ1BY97_9FIRM|nr:metallophosphoesterase family protein [Limnochorda sp. L945t]WRP17785.1 metallophosphoesterase family protein [Limnochorda sp. L945t]
MRVAVFSDVHGNRHALEAVLQDAAGHADLLVCAGDLAWGGPFPEAVIRTLRDFRIPCVVGNTDLALLQESGASHPWGRWALGRLSPEDLEFVRGLPLQHRIAPPGGAAPDKSPQEVLVVHSSLDDPARPLPHRTQEEGLEKLFGQAPARVVVHGHDHQAYRVDLRRVTVVGTGSVGLPLDGDPRASYVLLTWAGDGTWQVEHRRIVYDVDGAAQEAQRTGMPGVQRWAVAIRRGLPPDRVSL